MTTTTQQPTAAAPQAAPGRGMRFTGWAANYIDERTSASTAVKTLGRKIFPDHWSFMLGEVALYSFIVILISGTFLTFFFDPSMTEVEYEGSYVPLQGIPMSVAYHTALDMCRFAYILCQKQLQVHGVVSSYLIMIRAVSNSSLLFRPAVCIVCMANVYYSRSCLE